MSDRAAIRVISEGDSADEWLRVGQAARLLAIGEKRVRQLADSGALETQRTPLGRLISRASVEDYRRRHKAGLGDRA